MIVRAAGRKPLHNASKTLLPAFEEIHLPWLCPALLGRPTRHQSRRSTATVAEKRFGAPSSPSLQQGRKAATPLSHPSSRGFAYAAVDDHGPNADRYIPFESYRPPAQLWAGEDPLSSVRAFDPSSLLIMEDSVRPSPRLFRHINGIGGEVSEIERTLQACLTVGRLERAATTMRRLNSIFKPDAPELVKLHNDYIRALVNRVIKTKNQNLLKQIQRWFEVDLRGKGIQPDDTTYALMIRAAFQEANVLKIDRTIRRYIGLADEAGFRDRAMEATLNILNSQEIGRVTRIAPMTFHAAEEVPIEEMDQDESNQTTRLSDPLSHAGASTDESPVRSTEQKGVGLSSLKKSLSIFSSLSDLPLPDDMQSTEEDRKQAYNYMRQERLEKDTLTAALNRWRLEHNQAHIRGALSTTLQTRPIGALMWTWHEELVPLIREEIRKSNQAEETASAKPLGPELCTYGPFLQYLSPEKLSAVTIIYCLDKMAKIGVNRGTKITPLVMQIGKTVQEESAAETITNWYDRWLWKGAEDRKRRLKYLIKMRRFRHDQTPLAPTNAQATSIEKTQTEPVTYEPWPSTIQCRVGAVLISLLIQAAKMDVFREDPTTGHVSREVQPVFWTSHQYEAGKRIGVIRMNTAMGEKMSKEPLGSALAKHLPMLTEPIPWTSHNKGGFLQQSLSVVRVGNNHKQSYEYIKAAAESGDMSQVFAALNVLGKTPWRINKEVFDVMLQVWNTGEAIANIPAENPTFDYPPEPSPSDDRITRAKYAYRLKEIEGRRDGLHSERCFQNFQLEVARAFLDETFYFPHNVDFRGRAYPVPPQLNHMGADNCRGLLLFGKGRELGEAGLRWLKVHVANVFGYDKASLQERCDFATNHISDIYDSVNNPMTGAGWWLKAEDPWQCLAACIELKNALESPDPLKFVSHLPVHQDGTCNGLQHYAALGGDAIGAKQVNLEPGDRPSDIYTAVADMVKKDIADDAAKGDETAKLINGKITRKVVKPTVMTNVYGVTFVGAKRQVLAQLEDIYPDLFKDDFLLGSRVALYVAKKIFTALSAMFNGAQEIQYWLGECASRICESLTPAQMQRIEDQAAGKAIPSPYAGKAVNETRNQDEQTRFKNSVIWTTPLKMPVVQPYRAPASRRVQTNLQQVSLIEPTVADPVSKRKQLQGFPPNFIHSLDATHMLLSALKCNELGLTFAAVHDSFWTHAADIDTMNTVLRDAFIRMHSEDVIGRLAAEFAARYKGCMYLASVQHHSPLGQKIYALRGKARTSRTMLKIKLQELLVERTRLRLLASTDPAERAQGEAMLTPASLFAAHATDSDLVTVENTEALAGAIGSMAEPAPSAEETAESQAEAEAEAESDLDVSDAVPDFPSLGTTNRLDRANMVFEQAEKGLSQAEVADAKREARNRWRAAKKKVWLWLPLTFPKVPKKGSFDVKRLRDSTYFFS